MGSDGTGIPPAAARKDDHLRLAAQQAPSPRNDFDDVEFVHHALAGIDRGDVRLGVRVDGWEWPAPLFVNGMTGGSPAAERVNRALAIAARETGVPMGSGSASIALDDPAAARSFRVIRDENPGGFVLANIGAGRSPDDARRAVDLLEADGLQLHLNAVQETVMPEGSRDFSSWARGVEVVIAASPVPVVVKEVGFGLSRRTLVALRDMGARIADVGGSGGTDFARIEGSRRGAGREELAGYGQSAAACLLDAPAFPALLASGGVRGPIDVVRSLALGARAAGVAGPFLRAALDGGEDALVPMIGGWIERIAELLALLGAPSPERLAATDLLVRGRVREFCELRGIDAGALTRRSDETDGERS
ncbi:type 2 isopentenyl-diphosphate Delta-isomerase [Microbacterium indicum]|uniref:type 2 isopentenyl-diphosphate Delta-isomerase n=1 Tax=Microbacterium indicum TaxID=358100 RepID=UPI000429FB88|nr:type 2 isopentenyl-diphosphate Delta-isomerase [Microbacterium indicum]